MIFKGEAMSILKFFVLFLQFLFLGEKKKNRKDINEVILNNLQGITTYFDQSLL